MDIKLKNMPIDVEVSLYQDTIMTTFSGIGYKAYTHNLDSGKLKNFIKEIKALFKDFDEIYSEILKKYKLK